MSATISGMMNRGKMRDMAYSKFWKFLDHSTNRRDLYSILKKELRSPGLSRTLVNSCDGVTVEIHSNTSDGVGRGTIKL